MISFLIGLPRMSLVQVFKTDSQGLYSLCYFLVSLWKLLLFSWLCLLSKSLQCMTYSWDLGNSASVKNVITIWKSCVRNAVMCRIQKGYALVELCSYISSFWPWEFSTVWLPSALFFRTVSGKEEVELCELFSLMQPLGLLLLEDWICLLGGEVDYWKERTAGVICLKHM